jgi:alanine racemase
MPTLEQAGAVLEIDLDALVANYRSLADTAKGAICAAVVKADGYGLGGLEVARALAACGCTHFFVAHVGEGIVLRQALPGIRIYILHGPPPGAEADCRAHRLIPVLNDPGQIERWAPRERSSANLAAILHIDTGMNRLGLTENQVQALADRPADLGGLDIDFVISHLVAAEERDNPSNDAQRRRFDELRSRLPAAPAGLANSSGIFLGAPFHYDLVRPGVALYGVNPTPGSANPMAEVVNLKGKIVQVREIDRGQGVGYGATYRAAGKRKIATIPVGYADGYPRSLGNRAMASLAGVMVPVVGRVSMDLITIDVSDVPSGEVHIGAMVDLIGGGVDIDSLAAQGDTIGYEVLTSLAGRFHRVYRGGGVLKHE